MCLCGELRGGRFDDCLDSKGAHREPRDKKTKEEVFPSPYFYVKKC